MKILVVIPPYVLGEGNEAVLPNKAMLPVGPLVVAGQLRKRGHEVEVLDLVFEEEWWQALPQTVPDAVLLSCHTVRNVPVCAAVLGELTKVWSRRPHTVLGGNIAFDIGIADFARLGLEVDAVVRGFAHDVDVLEAIEKRLTADIHPDKKHLTGDLPVPALDLLSPTVHACYLVASGGRYPLYGLGLGCRWDCAYCSSKGNLPWTPRSTPTSVAEQISLAKQLGYSEIWAVDNLLFTDLAATLEFDFLVAANGMTWSGMTRAELVCELPEDFLGQLNSLHEVALGVESVTFSVLKILHRGRVRGYCVTITTAVFRLKAVGIVVNLFVILGLPGMTEEDFSALWKFIEVLHPSTISWSFYNPPVRVVAEGKVLPADTGFYRWPFSGLSAVPSERVVQWAMLLSGRWWCGWTPKSDPYWEEGKEFGVDFLEYLLLQEKSARSPVGDLWEIWKERRNHAQSA